MGRAVRQFNKEVSFRLETEVGYVTSNYMGRAACQFNKEYSFRLETGAGHVTSNFMGRAIHQFDKRVSFRLGKGVEMLNQTVWDAPSASSIKKLVLG